jgi:enoyl-CoA hydratase
MRLMGGRALESPLSGACGIKPVAHTCASSHAGGSAVPNTVLVTREPPIAVVQLNRPDVLNALNEEVLGELVTALAALDDDPEIRCIVLTGNERAFAAGADIKENFVTATPVTMLAQDLTSRWEAIRRVKTPIVAAVSGFALGGGCELAMICDIIVASETAKFGQPEINLGIIPGAGGTQRLTRAVGKWVANEIILTGRFVGAQEAKAIGLVAQVYPAVSWLQDAKTLARTIAEKAPVAARLATEAVDLAWNSTLDAGLEFERKAFYLLFATEDKKEGVDAFVNKRKANFKGK